MRADFTFKIGGQAGQGIDSMGHLLAHIFASGGMYVFANQDYESRIRGGHNFFQIRLKDEPVYAMSEEVNMLLALDEETVKIHRNEVLEDGLIIFDGEKFKVDSDPRLFPIPLLSLAQEKGGSKVMVNTVAAGVALCLVNYPFNFLAEMLDKIFRKKGRDIVESNIKAGQAGYDYVREHFRGQFPYELKPVEAPRRMLMEGNEAVALGAMVAGCKFIAGYPMTPSTPILQYMAGKAQEYDLVAIHAEDEIAAMNMAVGASYAGVRSMVATSGGGFSLMVEALGLAGMTETPIVAVNGQRPGPSTGLPTRTEQADLQFILHASQGEFPRAIFAPGTVEDAFHLTVKAFNIAEKYQVSVIILTDQHLADSYSTVEKFDLSHVKIERGAFADTRSGEYKRHKLTKSGVSPRAFPGQKGILVVTDSDEHTEDGHLTEDLELRPKMVLKRLHKLMGVMLEIQNPRIYGSDNAKITLIGWGSTYGAIREAVDMLRGEGVDVNMLHLSEIWPLPAEAVSKVVDRAEITIIVENNATAQLARLIKTETGRSVHRKILKFDGRPFSPAYIARRVKEEVEK